MSGNIFDYLEWRGDLSFRQSSFNAVDALIFSCLTYINYPVAYDGISDLRSAYDAWTKLPKKDRFRGIDMMKPCMELAGKVASSKRFADVKLTRYVESSSEVTEKQFSAMTFLLPTKTIFIAYRGTDNTLVGWKEDFNMAFTDGTPAQHDAEKYAYRIVSDFPEMQIETGGHSKGGNLAVWAAVHLPEDAKKRIKNIYNLDGPGFTEKMIESDEYRSVSGRILSLVPEASVIGVLMGCCDYISIKSRNLSLLQHDPFSWEISGKNFEYIKERSKSSTAIEKMINDTIKSLEPEQISQFIDEIYHDLREYDAQTLDDLKKHTLKYVTTVLPKFAKLREMTNENEKRKREKKDAN